MKKSETDSKIPQVQINIMGSDGEWYQPHQVPAALAAFRAIGADIAQYSGTYSEDNLRQFRVALRELDEQISKRIGKADES